MISLKKITEDNYKECLELSVAENQKSFVSSIENSLAKAYVFSNIVTPFAIYSDETMVGFILLRFNEEYSNYFIWQFMIDEKYQGRGFGKQSMIVAIEWMKQDKRCDSIVIAYIKGNDRAEKLYTKLGFQQMNEVEDQEVEMILHF
ncbi:GNAT family N-acetyltransferase [Sporosalibacterium faouarense]|uniref:GNAT family N-acetyltransferase n=1 Tax=Sporosalibacterium faouarense TaxID=516123 RepID=UPI00141C4479|nr:GNAT family N-acetyltransferase [Sporosalibacterium faouarense]MTI49922.1 GNAT family N-acetyltransferase [Bacillota bacterium]